jgi:hypothetical protein
LLPRDSVRVLAKSYSNGISGALGGMSSAIVACPLYNDNNLETFSGELFLNYAPHSDVVKTRLQVQRHDLHYRGGIISTAKTIFLEEGTRGFFSGLTPTLVVQSVGLPCPLIE